MDAVAELHKALSVEAQIGDATRHGLGDDAAGAGPQTALLPDLTHLLDVGLQIVRGAIDQGLGDAHGGLRGIHANGLLDVAEHHVVHTPLAGASGTPEARVHAGKGLDLQRDVLDDMAHPGAAFHAFPEAAFMFLAAAVAVHAGQQRLDAFEEAGDLVRGLLFELLDVEAHDDQLVPFDGPVVGATHGLELEDAHDDRPR